MTAADSLRQALEKAREGGELLESLTFDHVDASALDFSDLTGRHLAFHACRFAECDLSGAAFYNRLPLHTVPLSCKLLEILPPHRMQERRRRLPPKPVQGLLPGRRRIPLRQLHRQRPGPLYAKQVRFHGIHPGRVQNL